MRQGGKGRSHLKVFPFKRVVLSVIKATTYTFFTFQDIISPGLVREFVVLDVPQVGEDKNQITLSARSLDSSMLWSRMEQMSEISTQVRNVCDFHGAFRVLIAAVVEESGEAEQCNMSAGL